MKSLKINFSILLLVGLILLSFTLLHMKTTTTQMDQITVTDGDTLWTLAAQYVDAEERTEWINTVIAMNFMTTSTIEVGQNLSIPSDEQFNYLGEPTQLAGVNE